MNPYYPRTRFYPDRRGPAPRAFFALGLWLRTGFVALSLAAIALIMLANGEAGALAAIASAIAGVLVAGFAWRRAWVLIEGLEPAEPANAEPASPRPRSGGFGAPLESAGSR